MGASPSAKLGLVRTLLSEARLAVRLLREPAVPGLLKLVPAAAAAYLIWPLDILPDLLPVVGQLDDLGVILAGVQGFIYLCPEAPPPSTARRWRPDGDSRRCLASRTASSTPSFGDSEDDLLHAKGLDRIHGCGTTRGHVARERSGRAQHECDGE